MDGKGSGVSLLVMVLAAALSVLALADKDVYYTLEVAVIGKTGTAADTYYVSIGERVTLGCSTNGCLVNARLEWLDGSVPIRQSLNNTELERNGSMLFLHIHEFSVENYGRYHCRCVKDYSRNPSLSQTKHVSYNYVQTLSEQVFCNSEVNTVHLLPGDHFSVNETIEEYFVNEQGDTRHLSCASGRWVVQRALSLPEHVQRQITYNITISKFTDQAKLACLDSSNGLQKIFYVSIQDYHQLPLELIRPLDNHTSAIDVSVRGWPAVCLPQPYLHNKSKSFSLFLFINGTDSTRRRGPMIRVDSYNTAIFFNTRFHFNNLKLQNSSRDLYRYSRFSCRASSKWEHNLTVNFTIIEPDDDDVPLQPCPTSATILKSSHRASLLPSISPTPSSPHTSSLQPISTEPSHQTAVPIKPTAVSIEPSHQTAVATEPSHQTAVPIEPTAVSIEPSRQTLPLSSSAPTSSNLTSSSPRDTIIFATAGLISVLVGAIALLCATYLCCRCHDRSSRHFPMKGLAPKDLLAEFGIDPLPEAYFGEQEPGGTVFPISKQLVNCISEHAEKDLFFPYEQLELGDDLGSGAFGIVKKAIVHTDGSPVVVAVKMLKDKTSEEDERDLISEFKVLEHVGIHPNIVSFLGATIHKGNLHLIVEFCGQGNLLRFLRSRRNDCSHEALTHQHLVAMAGQVVQGMQHLSSKKCIHRDLAARNVLVTDNLVMKVADFGLARKMYDSIYRPSGGRVPIKWMSLETILDREYTTQSDVWSFGVLLWEIMSLGRSPYPGKSAEEVIKCIEQGYRMPAPDRCPEKVYSLMLMCWDQVPSARPSFSELCEITEELGAELEMGTESGMVKEDLELENEEYLDQQEGTSGVCSYCAYCQCSNASISQLDHMTYINDSTNSEPEVKGSREKNGGMALTHLHELEGGGETRQERIKHTSIQFDTVNFTANSTPLTHSHMHHHSTSVPYLPVVWSSSDYLPLLQSSPLLVAFTPPGNGDPGSMHSLCSTCKCSYRNIVPGNDPTSRHTVYQPSSHSLMANSLESICSRYEELDSFSAHHEASQPSQSSQPSQPRQPNQPSQPSQPSQSPVQNQRRGKVIPNSLPVQTKTPGKKPIQSNLSNDSGMMTMSPVTPKPSLKSSVGDINEEEGEEFCVKMDACSSGDTLHLEDLKRADGLETFLSEDSERDDGFLCEDSEQNGNCLELQGDCKDAGYFDRLEYFNRLEAVGSETQSQLQV